MNLDPKPNYDYIEVNTAEYKQLLKAREKLFALEAAGVNNWEGYAEALGADAADFEEDAE